MNIAAPICSDTACRVQVDGVCRLGNDPVEGCPHYAIEMDDIEEPAQEQEPPIAQPVPIWSSEALLLENLVALKRQRQVRTIALVGEQKVGKTTLLASIYGAYCKGPFAGLTFVGSETLLAFARLQSFALVSSGRGSPTVPRTSRRDPLSFFHLALARGGGEVLDLAIADRSGETYTAARTSTDLISTLAELRHADRVCFLLDGARLASMDSRTAYTRHFRQMINALNDNGALATAQDVEILSTKFDITSTANLEDKNIEFLDEYQARLVSDFQRKGLAISSHHICALPKADRGVGFVGLDEMVRRWTAPTPPPMVAPQPLRDATRQFDRLLAKA
ncbi:hypothetical protein IG197_05335 [Aminobacter sp. SR38]|jgi:hypothetical protein|uniref:TRAFAC clade GTPase domain-containing protein n=1 Tax=Aminobacter sp. SR38 TaxID=2774562 RepID=UPI00177C2A3E|nr:hypothetical protein [Aminobacter sp. SR38]QOF72502.1 hypothetical protein IG197_05335 [Aminobacter sp. SR38]